MVTFITGQIRIVMQKQEPDNDKPKEEKEACLKCYDQTEQNPKMLESFAGVGFSTEIGN